MADSSDNSDFRKDTYEKNAFDRNQRTSENKHSSFDKKSHGSLERKPHGNSERKSRNASEKNQTASSEKKMRESRGGMLDKTVTSSSEMVLASEIPQSTSESNQHSVSEKSSRAASETSQNDMSEKNLSDASEENPTGAEKKLSCFEIDKNNEKTISGIDLNDENNPDDVSERFTGDISGMYPSFSSEETTPECAPPPITYQSITAMDCEMGAVAKSDFNAGNYDSCIKSLKHLQSSRPHDTRILHNTAVAEFYDSKCTKVTELYHNLLAVCEKAKIYLQNINSMEDLDQCVVLYNRAVILYHLHKYRGAIHILDKLLPFVEPLDDSLGQKICLLLLELYLLTNQPKKALGLIAYAEAMLLSEPISKTRKSPEKEESSETVVDNKLKLKLIQYKAQCYTMMKTAKPCKREVKALMTSGIKSHHIAAFIIKSHLEYQRGNYRKAMKILNSPEWPEDYSKYFQGTGDCLQALYYNNLGCIQYQMQKPSLGAFYVQRGIKELDSEMNKIRVKETDDGALAHPLYTLNLNVRRKLIYNLGMLNFEQQKYEEAFKCFVQVSEYYFDNPQLWLRIAECCIQCHSKDKSGYKHCQVVESIVGTSSSRNLILTPGDLTVARSDSDSDEAEPAFGSVSSLAFALRALKNALLLLPKDCPFESKDLKESSTQAILEKDLLQDNACMSGLPSNAISKAEAQEMKNACLVACSYASLHSGDPVMAHHYSLQLLAQPNVSEGHKYLAHMYAGEALVHMDKFSAAIEHFNPDAISVISLNLPSDDSVLKFPSKSGSPSAESKTEEDNGDSLYKINEGYYPHSVNSAKMIAQYNLGVMYALRGEWSKSIDCLSELINCPDAPAQSKALMFYIHLCQGSTDLALSYLNHCGSSDVQDECYVQKQAGTSWTGSERLVSDLKDSNNDL